MSLLLPNLKLMPTVLLLLVKFKLLLLLVTLKCTEILAAAAAAAAAAKVTTIAAAVAVEVITTNAAAVGVEPERVTLQLLPTPEEQHRAQCCSCSRGAHRRTPPKHSGLLILKGFAPQVAAAAAEAGFEVELVVAAACDMLQLALSEGAFEVHSGR